MPAENSVPTETFAVIAGGGTAGHVLPGIAIGHALVDLGHPKASIHFVGSDRGIERRLVPEAGFPLTVLPGRGIQRRSDVRERQLPRSGSCARAGRRSRSCAGCVRTWSSRWVGMRACPPRSPRGCCASRSWSPSRTQCPERRTVWWPGSRKPAPCRSSAPSCPARWSPATPCVKRSAPSADLAIARRPGPALDIDADRGSSPCSVVRSAPAASTTPCSARSSSGASEATSPFATCMGERDWPRYEQQATRPCRRCIAKAASSISR